MDKQTNELQKTGKKKEQAKKQSDAQTSMYKQTNKCVDEQKNQQTYHEIVHKSLNL